MIKNVDFISQLWDSYHLQLRNYISSKIKDKNEVEDILQECFIKAHKYQNQIHDLKKVKSWIFQIVRNTVNDYYRKNKFIDAPRISFAESISCKKKSKNEEVASRIHKFIDLLPDNYREALILSDIEGYSHKEISDKLKISLPATKSRVLRGRGKLKKLLDNCCFFETDKWGNIINYYRK